jgi:hypothetical protein
MLVSSFIFWEGGIAMVYPRVFFGGPFLGGFLGGLLGSTLALPLFFRPRPYYPYPSYYPYGGFLY